MSFIPITQAHSVILAKTGQDVSDCYNRLKALGYNGQAPIEKVGNQLGFYQQNLPAICDALGLKPAEGNAPAGGQVNAA